MRKHRLWVGFLLILVLWYMGHFLIDPRLIPAPGKTLLVLLRLMTSGEIIVHILFSLYRLSTAIVLSLILGTLSGLLIGMNHKVEAVMAPFIYVMFPVPKAALLPVLFLLFGLGNTTKILLILLILYFQVTLSVYDGVKQIPDHVFLSARTLRLEGLELYGHVIIPSVLPQIFSALRISVGIGIAVLFFAETYATKYGLGYFIMNHWSLLNYEHMYGGILVLGGLGYSIFRGIDYLKDRVVHWS